MAVIQISTIQVRQGQKNQGSGIPQLASGELGWAIDAQELYIGNGSVANGAPAVGNTKILTEHDDIIGSIKSYAYREGAAEAIPRTLQQRLDDRVSVRGFGINGDGTTCADRLQNVLDELYNTQTASQRAILYVEPGVYYLEKTVYLPSYATIVGAGPNKTIFKQTASATGPAFSIAHARPIGDDQLPVVDEDNRPRSVFVYGASIDSSEKEESSSIVQIMHATQCVFEAINCTGNYEPGSAVVAETAALDLLPGESGIFLNDYNTFKNITVTNAVNAVYATLNLRHNTFDNFDIDGTNRGIVIGEAAVGEGLVIPANNLIVNCEFGAHEFGITNAGLVVDTGIHNVSRSNRFYNVGNNQALPTDNTAVKYPNINLSSGNYSFNDWFERTALTVSTGELVITPVIEGSGNYLLDTVTKPIETRLEPAPLLHLSASSSSVYEIEYWYSSAVTDAKRSGTLVLQLDLATASVDIVDEYTYTGDASYDDALLFSALLVDNNADGTVETLDLQYKNTLPSDNSVIVMQISTKTRN